MENEKDEKINIALWKNFISFGKPYKKEFKILIIVMAFVGIIDAVFPLMTKWAVDNLITNISTKKFVNFSVLYALLVAIQAINAYLLISTAGKIEMGMAYNIRKIGFEKLQILLCLIMIIKP